MEIIKVDKSDFGKILQTAETLLDEVENVLQDDIVKKRIAEIKAGKVKGRPESDLDQYLKKRGITIG